ncbi:MAG: hypothetical protein QXL17_01315 [Candidatus Thermoplasmatota archaeon]
MRELTKARLTVGLLAFFASVWIVIRKIFISFDQLFITFGFIVLLLFVILILSVVILGILEWVHIFDLRTNSILTLIVVIVISVSTVL